MNSEPTVNFLNVKTPSQYWNRFNGILESEMKRQSEIVYDDLFNQERVNIVLDLRRWEL